jgi:hypothetical protein
MGSMYQARRFLLEAILLATVIATPHVYAQPVLDSRSLIFYFDISTMSKADQTRAISAAEMLIQRNARAEDRLAVTVFDGTNKVAVQQEFTNDRNRVLAAVRRIADSPAGSVNANPARLHPSRLSCWAAFPSWPCLRCIRNARKAIRCSSVDKGRRLRTRQLALRAPGGL